MEKDSPQIKIPLIPPMYNLPQMLKQEKLNLHKGVIEHESLMEALNAKHDPTAANFSTKGPPLVFERLARGQVELDVIQKNRTDITIKGGDGKTSLRNGNPTSTGADFVIESNQGNMQGQIKVGATKQNTIKLAGKHYDNPEYKDIKVYGPGDHQQEGLVNNKIQFENIKAEMPTKKQLDAFMKANKTLLEKEGPKFIKAQRQLADINNKLQKLNKDYENFVKYGKDTKTIQEKMTQLNVRKQEQLALRNQAEMNIQNSMTQFYSRQINWKNIIGQGMAYGGLAGGVAGLFNSIIEILDGYIKGNLTTAQVFESLGKNVLIGGTSGAVIGGLEAFGAEMLKSAQKFASKALGGICKYAGPILIALLHFCTIKTIIYTTEASVQDRRNMVLYKSGLLAVSLGAVIGISCLITGPLGFAIGLAVGTGIGILDHYFGPQLSSTAVVRLDINYFLEELSGCRSKFFGAPQIKTKAVGAPEGFKTKAFGVPDSKKTSNNKAFGAPKLG